MARMGALEIGGGKEALCAAEETRRDYAGVIMSLARQETPDTSAYNDPEIVYRVPKHHHAGFVLSAPKPERIANCSIPTARAFRDDFYATQPVPDKPTA